MYPLKLHKNLNLDKWATYSRGQQILMIANELNRANNFIKTGETDSVNMCYERAFELTDLTSSDSRWLENGRELRRFRELLAMLYADKHKNAELNQQLYMGLLRLSGEAYRMLYPEKAEKEQINETCFKCRRGAAEFYEDCSHSPGDAKIG